MKLALRIFALSVVFAGLAATLSSKPASSHAIASHLSATSGFPIPGCTPGFPTCAATR